MIERTLLLDMNSRVKKNTSFLYPPMNIILFSIVVEGTINLNVKYAVS